MSRAPTFDIVLSAENNPYTAWQCMLAHASLVTHLGHSPLLVVHGDPRRPLLHEFKRIEAAGGRIQRARNIKSHAGVHYPGRNTVSALLHAETDADYIVLGDPDMLLVKPLPAGAFPCAPEQVSFDRVGYLKLDEVNAGPLSKACSFLKIDYGQLSARPISGGVPHVIPRAVREALGREWLRIVDFFLERRLQVMKRPGKGYTPWLTNMWGLVLAVLKLNLRPILTELCVRNGAGARMTGPGMVHYCLGDRTFDKRDFYGDLVTCRRVWSLRRRRKVDESTVAGAIVAQIRAAARFYEIGDVDRWPR
jgi:hypothetical protein